MPGFCGEPASHRDDALSDALVRLLFTQFENIHIQPDWWEALSTACQRSLMARFTSFIDVFALPEPGFLTDNGLRFDPWPVIERRTIGFDL